MKKAISLILLFSLSSGCATYNFEASPKLYGGGYVVRRNNFLIPEYTIGEENKAPGDIQLAKERFGHRKGRVEHYYKRMGKIDSAFKSFFLDYVTTFLGLIIGIFKLPFIAISEHRYQTDPQYKERKDREDREAKRREQMRIEKLQDKLNEFIQKDLERERSPN